MFYFYFSCSCRIEHNQCYQKYDRGVRMCPFHKDANIEKIVFRCNDCGKEEIVKGIKTGVRKFCIECAKHQPYKYIKKALRPVSKKLIPVAPAVSKPDCRHYLSYCLPAVCKDPDATAVRCNFCHRYEKENMDIMEYETPINSADGMIYNYIPDDFQKHVRRIIKCAEKQAGKKPLSDSKARTSYLWGFNPKNRQKAIEKAKERVNADK